MIEKLFKFNRNKLKQNNNQKYQNNSDLILDLEMYKSSIIDSGIFLYKAPCAKLTANYIFNENG